MKVLVTGLPGVDKSDLLSLFGARAVDINKFGCYESMMWDNDQAFVISAEVIDHLMKNTKHEIFIGSCRNMTNKVTTVRQGRLGTNNILRDREPISCLGWDLKIFLWYEPNDLERSRRFTSGRGQEYGSRSEEWAEIKNYANATKKGLPSFESIDVTGLQSDIDLVNKIVLLTKDLEDEVCIYFVHQEHPHCHKCKLGGMCGYSKESGSHCSNFKSDKESDRQE